MYILCTCVSMRVYERERERESLPRAYSPAVGLWRSWEDELSSAQRRWPWMAFKRRWAAVESMTFDFILFLLFLACLFDWMNEDEVGNNNNILSSCWFRESVNYCVRIRDEGTLLKEDDEPIRLRTWDNEIDSEKIYYLIYWIFKNVKGVKCCA